MEEIAIDMNEMLITLTSDIVAAHVSNNSVAVDDVPVLIRNIFGALSGLGGEVVKEVAPPEPAVAIRNSVKRSHIVCLDRSEEHTSELQSLMRISYDVFCLKQKKKLYTAKPTVKVKTLNRR